MSTNNDYDSTFKILVLGDSGVGKTCLIYRYTEGIYSDVYVSTIGELFSLMMIHCTKICHTATSPFVCQGYNFKVLGLLMHPI